MYYYFNSKYSDLDNCFRKIVFINFINDFIDYLNFDRRC